MESLELVLWLGAMAAAGAGRGGSQANAVSCQHGAVVGKGPGCRKR